MSRARRSCSDSSTGSASRPITLSKLRGYEYFILSQSEVAQKSVPIPVDRSADHFYFDAQVELVDHTKGDGGLAQLTEGSLVFSETMTFCVANKYPKVFVFNNNTQNDTPRTLWKQVLSAICTDPGNCRKSSHLQKSIDFTFLIRLAKHSKARSQSDSEGPAEHTLSVRSSQLYTVNNFSNVALSIDLYFDDHAHLFNVSALIQPARV